MAYCNHCLKTLDTTSPARHFFADSYPVEKDTPVYCSVECAVAGRGLTDAEWEDLMRKHGLRNG